MARPPAASCWRRARSANRADRFPRSRIPGSAARGRAGAAAHAVAVARSLHARTHRAMRRPMPAGRGRRGDGRRHGERGRRVERSTRSAKGDIVLGRRRLADLRAVRRPGAAQARSGARADLDGARRARHAGHDRLHRPAATSDSPRPGETRGRRSGLRRGRLGGRARSRRSRAARASASPAGRTKCALCEELGFDDCVDHRAPDFAERLTAACPKGIDVYFENVGGAVFEAVLPLLNDFARVPVCGLIAHYNMTELPPRPEPPCRS